MQRNTNLQINFKVIGLIVLWGSLLAGCNLGSSTSEKQISTPLLEPRVRISSIKPTEQAKPLTTEGYYHINDEILVTLETAGSQNSDVTCSVSLQYLSSGSFVDSPSGSIAACNTIYFSLTTDAKVYRVLAKVTDANSKTSQTQRFLILSQDDIPYLMADFTPTIVSTSSSYAIKLDATSSKVGETGSIVSYVWQMSLKQDDSSTALVQTLTENGPVTSVAVNSDGIYVVKLTVTDAGGKASSMTKLFSVGIPGDDLEVSFVTTSVNPSAPLNLAVDASGSNVTAGVKHYIWQVYNSEDLTVKLYDDVVTESAVTTLPIITAGTYVIKLKIIDISGNEHEYSRVVQVS